MNTKEAMELFFEGLDMLVEDDSITKEDMKLIIKEILNDASVSKEDIETCLKFLLGDEIMSKKEIKEHFEAIKPKVIEQADLFDLGCRQT